MFLKIVPKFLIIAVLLCFISGTAKAVTDKTKKAKNVSYKALPVFPDEYTALDDVNPADLKTNDAIRKSLENSRQKYSQALNLIKQGDTVNAIKYFDQALDVLNRLISFPSIEQNPNFQDLAQSIVDDYESFVKNINDLDINSTFFIIRDRLLVDVENVKPATPRIEKLTIKPDSATLAELKDKDQKNIVIPLPDNEYVGKSITFLSQTKGGRRYFKNWLERSGKWFPMMKKIAKELKVPEELIYLSMIESALNPNAVSKAKAVGLWQFIRSTGKDYRLNDTGASAWIDERRDPEKSTRAAFKFLSDLYTSLGDWHLALAAYNTGEHNVQRVIKKTKKEKPDYWDIRPLLHRETRNYVPLYIATVKLAINPEAYGIDMSEIEYFDEYRYDIYTAKEPMNLTALAKCCNISLEELRDLNPELISTCTPPDVKEYKLKIPYGCRQAFLRNLASLTPEEKQPWAIHIAKRGETVSSISKEYNIDPEQILAANDLPGIKTTLKAGTKIRIPVEKQEIADAISTDSTNNAKSQEADANSLAKTTETKPLTDNKPADNKTSDKPVLLAGNSAVKAPEVNSAVITPASTDTKIIEIPAPVKTEVTNKTETAMKGEALADAKKTVTTETSKETETQKVTHIVSKGETLYSISNKYGISMADLRNLNNLSYDNDNIKVGSELVVAQNLAVSEPKAESAPAVKIHAAAGGKLKTVVHIVADGESLSQIADDYQTSIYSITSLNKIKDERIRVGQKIKIETSSDQVQVNAYTGTKPLTYKVRKGDNIGTIAARYEVTEDEIRKWNPEIAESSKLPAGKKLEIHVKEDAKGSSTGSSPKVNKMPKSYTVKSGETLSAISSKFGVSIAELKKKNKDIKGDKIRKGQKIRVQ